MIKWRKTISTVLILGGISYGTYNWYLFLEQRSLGSYGETAVKEALKPELAKKEIIPPKKVVLYPDKPKKGEQFAELIIPRINAVLPVVEGADPDDLEKGVGHYSGSVYPGEPDNSVLSGHRDTVFTRMGEVKQGDLVIVKTNAWRFTYKIKKMWVVDKEDRTVIVPHDRAVITLSTCYPFDALGAAPQRYILQGDLVELKPEPKRGGESEAGK
jgi:sortase A